MKVCEGGPAAQNLIVVASVLFLCLMAEKLSGKVGMPALILFMGVGMLFGSDGILRIAFDDYGLAQNICLIALCFIMFYGGFNMKWSAARPVAVKAICLSTIGVVVTAFASAVSQILLNVSAEKKYENRVKEYLNPWVVLSYMILAVVLVTNIYLLGFMNLKEENAIASLTYVFVLILSRIVLKEKITLKKILGNVLIIIGILIFIYV